MSVEWERKRNEGNSKILMQNTYCCNAVCSKRLNGAEEYIVCIHEWTVNTRTGLSFFYYCVECGEARKAAK